MEDNRHSDDEPIAKNPRKLSPIPLSKDSVAYMSDEDDAEDTTDSLDIKPPQAAVRHHKTKSKKDRQKHQYRDMSRREHGHVSKSDSSSHRKSHHHSREHREHKEERLREKRHHRQKHEEMRESRRERERRDREHPETLRSREKNDRGGERIVEDLREKLLDKRREEGERRVKRDRKDREREKERERDWSVEEVEEQELNLTPPPPPVKETPKEKAERLEREMRREKLLEAEREMMRQKEVYRRELEARRERRHLEKAQERTLREIVKKRGKSKDRKQKGDENEKSDTDKEGSEKYEEDEHMVVSVSDASDEEMTSEKADDTAHNTEDENQEGGKTPQTGDDSTEAEVDDEDDTESSTETEDEGETDESDHLLTPEDRKHSGSEDETDEKDPHKTESEKSSEKAADGAENHDVEDDEGDEGADDDESVVGIYYPALQGCRSVEEFQCLNRIEEGTYGVVYRARDKRTNEIVALKRLKMEKEKEGFPITSLREINTLLKAQHDNIVTVREIVVGSNMDKIFIVMNYVEHDLKSLMETMKHKKQAFIPGEVKCLMQQLLRAVAHLHDNWILHRDLKTSNLLLSHKGILKVGDFGLAREYGSPLKPYTPIVVTLWYRAPELLLGVKEYSTPIDMWSVGCIFGELLSMEALFPGKSDIDQLNRIFKELGTPNERIWPGYNKLPAVQKMSFTEYPVSQLRNRFGTEFTEMGMELMNKFLTYDPKQRVSAEDALKHQYFEEAPLPIDPAMFPTWPAKSELGYRKAMAASPKAPPGGAEYKQLNDTDDEVSSGGGFHMGAAEKGRSTAGGGFSLKF